MRISNCNCGKQLDCGCVPYFDTFLTNTISVLSVGNLVSDSCVFDEYVIDWYRDNEHAMISGKGYDPDIEAHHPFVGDAALPVVGGQWKPVLRYVVVGGIKIYPKPKKCQNWCSDLDVALPSAEVPYINVINLACGMVGGNPATWYDYRINYNTTQDFALATKTIRMYLADNGSSGYLALQFTGYLVADQIEVYYNEETTPLLAYIVGTNLAGNNVQVLPEEIDWNVINVVANISDREYAEGDFVTVKIYPAVKEPGNFNTNWTLDLKCLPRGVFECDLFNVNMRIINPDTVNVVYNTIDCRYEFRWEFMDYLSSSYATSYFYRYFRLINTSSQQVYTVFYQPEQMVWLNAKVTASNLTLYASGNYENMVGQVSYAKVGNIVDFQFTNATDYNAYKTTWQNVMGSVNIVNYSTNPTNINHYKYFFITWRETPGTCGDSYVQRTLRCHITSPVTFNDGAMTLQVEMLNVANGMVQQDCDESYDLAASWYNTVQTSILQTDFTGMTRCRNATPINGNFLRSTPAFETQRIFQRNSYFHAESMNSVCNLPLFAPIGASNFGFYYMYVRITITDPGDALNNFRIESQLNINTGELTGVWATVYEKSNGNQIIP